MPSGAKVAYLNKSRPRTDISDNERGLPLPNAADILSLRADRLLPRPRLLLKRGRWSSMPGWWLFSRSDGGERALTEEAAAAAAAAAMKAAAAEETGGNWGCWKVGGGERGELPSWLSGWCEMAEVGVVVRGGEHPAECEITGCGCRVVPGPRFAPPPGGERSNARGLCAPAI